MSNTSKFHTTLKNIKNSVGGAQDPEANVTAS